MGVVPANCITEHVGEASKEECKSYKNTPAQTSTLTTEEAGGHTKLPPVIENGGVEIYKLMANILNIFKFYILVY